MSIDTRVNVLRLLGAGSLLQKALRQCWHDEPNGSTMEWSHHDRAMEDWDRLVAEIGLDHMIPAAAAGMFSAESLNESGELHCAISASRATGLVSVSFANPVRHFSLKPDDIETFVDMLRSSATELREGNSDGRP